MNIPEIPNEYAIELTAPDISAYRMGNTGVPYVWQFDSGRSGPNVMVSAIVHGNEPCGAIALDWLLSSGFRPLAGRVTLAFMNVAAYEAFDPENPNASRWVEEDMNRVWASAVLDGDRTSIELERARQVRPFLEDTDYLFDIHSMQHLAPPLMLSGAHEKGRALAARVGVPQKAVVDRGHAAGTRMRDYGRFGDPDEPAAALLIECGQHWEASAEQLAKMATARFLDAVGVAPNGLAEGFGDPPGQQEFYSVTDVVTISSESFEFEQPFIGGEVLSEAGTPIGRDGDRTIVSPYPDCMLVMPSKRLWKGQTAVRLARKLDRSPVQTRHT